MDEDISLAQSYDEFPRIEATFQRRLDESLDPRGPDALWDEFQRLDPTIGEVVVDVGCGEGDDAIELARRFGLHVRGVDPVDRHVDIGIESAAGTQLADQVTFEVGSAEAMPLDSRSVDIVWAKEALMYADLDAAFREFRRVLRPGGRVFVYQVFTGPRMTDAEADEFWRQGPAANSVRPEELAQAASRAGFRVLFQTDFGSEWGEFAQERSGAGGRRLVHAARLLRDPSRFIEEFGRASYEIMLGDCLWHVYRMIGKLHGAAFGFER